MASSAVVQDDITELETHIHFDVLKSRNVVIFRCLSGNLHEKRITFRLPAKHIQFQTLNFSYIIDNKIAHATRIDWDGQFVSLFAGDTWEILANPMSFQGWSGGAGSDRIGIAVSVWSKCSQPVG